MAPQLKEDTFQRCQIIKKHFARKMDYLKSIEDQEIPDNLDLLASVAVVELEELQERKQKAKNQDRNFEKYREFVNELLLKNGHVPTFILLTSPDKKFKLDNNVLKLIIVSSNEITYRNYSKSITFDDLNLSKKQVLEAKRRLDTFDVMHTEMPSARSSDTHHLPTPEELARVDAELEVFKGKGKKVLRCPRNGCGQSFTAFPSLQKHLKSQHYRIAEFPCPLCDVPFTRQNSLEYHMLCHFKIQLFECHVCHEEFRHQQHFKTHLGRRHGISSREAAEAVDKGNVSDSELILLAIEVFNKEGSGKNEILGTSYGQWRQWLNGQGAKPVKIKREIAEVPMKNKREMPAAPLKINREIQEVPVKFNREIPDPVPEKINQVIPVPVPAKMQWKNPTNTTLDSGYQSLENMSPIAPIIASQESMKRKSEENIAPQAKRCAVFYPPTHSSTPSQVLVTSQAAPPPPDAQVWIEATHKMPEMVVPRTDEGLMSRVPLAARTSIFNRIQISYPRSLNNEEWVSQSHKSQ